jgi:hypothetical protein
MKVKILSWDAGDNGYEIISVHTTDDGLNKAIELLMRRNMKHFKFWAGEDDFIEVNELLDSGSIQEAMQYWNTAQHERMFDSDELVYLQVDEIEVTE